MTPEQEIFDMLGVEPGNLNITNVHITNWGTDVQLDLEYRPADEQPAQPFQLVFEDCRSLTWDVHDYSDEQDVTTIVLGLFLGEGQHQESAIIYTDIFELSVQYGEMLVVKRW